MPKIEVSTKALYKYMGKKVTGQEFIDLIQCAKAELDEEDGDTLKIELNDTNRPDLWSTAGFGRLLKLYLGGKIPEYPFFSA
jgi:phenylalanyl-tRNA synthetase beta chain